MEELSIALIGEAGGGKSTLAFSLSNFLRKKGFSCEIADLDPAPTKPKYHPFFEVRKFSGSEKTLKATYEKIAAKPSVLKARARIVFLDTAGSLEFFLLDPALLKECCDCVFFVCDYQAARPVSNAFLNSLVVLAEKRFGKPTLAVVNKSDLARGGKPQRTLGSSEEALQNSKGVVFASGLEGIGFNELFEFIKKR